ncbi:MAG: bL28 family ribosomal protein, partial [Dehalococcoidia bacterium]|nr:bL28 family ribosomal protein [Dehalococcoidia bacterium]
MARCAICGKGTTFGRNIRHKHAGRWERRAPKTNRVFRANIQKRTMTIEGRPVRIA